MKASKVSDILKSQRASLVGEKKELINNILKRENGMRLAEIVASLSALSKLVVRNDPQILFRKTRESVFRNEEEVANFLVLLASHLENGLNSETSRTGEQKIEIKLLQKNAKIISKILSKKNKWGMRQEFKEWIVGRTYARFPKFQLFNESPLFVLIQMLGEFDSFRQQKMSGKGFEYGTARFITSLLKQRGGKNYRRNLALLIVAQELEFICQRSPDKTTCTLVECFLNLKDAIDAKVVSDLRSSTGKVSKKTKQIRSSFLK